MLLNATFEHRMQPTLRLGISNQKIPSGPDVSVLEVETEQSRDVLLHHSMLVRESKLRGNQ
jgi:hypothetical protein